MQSTQNSGWHTVRTIQVVAVIDRKEKCSLADVGRRGIYGKEIRYLTELTGKLEKAHKMGRNKDIYAAGSFRLCSTTLPPALLPPTPLNPRHLGTLFPLVLCMAPTTMGQLMVPQISPRPTLSITCYSQSPRQGIW